MSFATETEMKWFKGISEFLKDLVVPKNYYEEPVDMKQALASTEEPKRERPGLEAGWTVGERIPWKGIWFVVEKVDRTKLTLVPETMTSNKSKELHQRRYGRG